MMSQNLKSTFWQFGTLWNKNGYSDSLAAARRHFDGGRGIRLPNFPPLVNAPATAETLYGPTASQYTHTATALYSEH